MTRFALRLNSLLLGHSLASGFWASAFLFAAALVFLLLAMREWGELD